MRNMFSMMMVDHLADAQNRCTDVFWTDVQNRFAHDAN